MKYKLEMKPIKIRLAEKDMSVRKLASKVKMDVSTLYNYFKGRSQPTMKFMLKICNYLELNPAVLFVEVKKKRKRK